MECPNMLRYSFIIIIFSDVFFFFFPFFFWTYWDLNLETPMNPPQPMTSQARPQGPKYSLIMLCVCLFNICKLVHLGAWKTYWIYHYVQTLGLMALDAPGPSQMGCGLMQWEDSMASGFWMYGSIMRNNEIFQ